MGTPSSDAMSFRGPGRHETSRSSLTSLDDEDTVDDLLAMSTNDPVEVRSVVEEFVEIIAVTHRGRVRSSNEDQFAVVRRNRSGVVLASSMTSNELTHDDRTA